MELTQEQREHLLIAMFYSNLSTQALIEVMLIYMTSEKEDEEVWALNGLRTFGEIKRKYKDNPDTSIAHKETTDLLKKMIEFYFANYEKANSE